MGASCYSSTHNTEVFIAERCNGSTMLLIHTPYWGLYRRKMQWEHHATHPPTILSSISQKDAMGASCYSSTHNTEVCIAERRNGSIMVLIHPPYRDLYYRKMQWEHHATHPPTILSSISQKDAMGASCYSSNHNTEFYIAERCNGSIMLLIHPQY